MLDRARDQEQVIRYVGVVDPKKGCTVGLKNYPRSHVFARTNGAITLSPLRRDDTIPNRSSFGDPARGLPSPRQAYSPIFLGSLLT